jgi:hypothetical protein
MNELLRYWAFKLCGKGEQEEAASDVMTAAATEIERLRAENALLRAALEDLLDDTWVGDFGEWFEDRLKQARAALEWKP